MKTQKKPKINHNCPFLRGDKLCVNKINIEPKKKKRECKMENYLDCPYYLAHLENYNNKILINKLKGGRK